MTAHKSIELFAGTGGLALGTAKAGFEHQVVIEWDRNACQTLRKNSAAGVEHVRDWRIFEGDVHQYDFSQHKGVVDFIFGGPPCQPFSLGGKHKGQSDARNMFPEAIRAVRETMPKAFVLENVKGLLRRGFTNYYNYIIQQLRFPTVTLKGDEEWQHHHARLERLTTGGRFSAPQYNVVYRLLNAANYGVPQHRERVFIVGVRSDLGIEFDFPHPTHSEDGLLYQKWVGGTYWDRHCIPKAKRPTLPDHLKARIKDLRNHWPELLPLPWRTVRDAIGDLPTLRSGQTCRGVPNHFLNPGARSYPGHTGCDCDEPAKTLKAGDHGVPGGENTLRLDNGKVRYFSVRECARLQAFPDDWIFEGSWTECMRQLGNAVPVSLGHVVASRVAVVVKSAERRARFSQSTIGAGVS